MLDGYLARKYGPTVLGGLMDPIADKVFVAATLLVLADLGWTPWWVVHVVLVRELAVTALRSSFEQRRRTLQTTYLAKVKTWVQMFVLAVVVGLNVLPARAMTVAFIAIAAAAVLGAVTAQLMSRRWRGIWIFAGFFVVGTSLHVAIGPHALLLALYLVVAAITWGSALDYLSVAVRELAGARDLHAFDSWRLLGAVLIPVLAALCLARLPVMPWPIVAIVVAEIFHGGLDNLLAHHGAAARAVAWAGRTLTVSALLGAALALPQAADWLILAAMVVTAVATTIEFVRNRRHYL
jgi:CDP-diacylglycerol--glycerol-3-phosphate 3-phosphatidyltransferase